LPAEGTRQMGDENNWRRFEQLAMPHLAWRDLADASSTEPPAIAIRKAEREQINADGVTLYYRDIGPRTSTAAAAQDMRSQIAKSA